MSMPQSLEFINMLAWQKVLSRCKFRILKLERLSLYWRPNIIVGSYYEDVEGYVLEKMNAGRPGFDPWV